MKFYQFRQNNSGGSFHHDAAAGIGYNVIIEANSETEAICKAEDIGLYFDGVDSGDDCECCGDRWYGCYEISEKDLLENANMLGIPSYVHYVDGYIKELK